MNIRHRIALNPLLFAAACAAAGGAGAVATGPGGNNPAAALDYEAKPPLVVEGADPFLMINLSVELTQQAESFTDGQQTYAGGTFCPGRASWNGINNVGLCFTNSEEYIGYFDSNKCYSYTSGSTSFENALQVATGPRSGIDPDYFRPVGPTNSNRECSGAQFSGNFLNWATMTALDQFRAAMTGGARLVDTAGGNARTLLARTYRYDDWNFVDKAISSATSGSLEAETGSTTFVTNIGGVTPWGNAAAVRIDNRFSDSGYPSGHRTRFILYDSGGNVIDTHIHNVLVEVCDDSAGLEDNCVAYSDSSDTWHKPEGLLQQNAQKMRYALSSYTARSGNGIDGGVLRSEAKFIGRLRPSADGGLEDNLVAEIDDDGTYAFDPDGLAGSGGVVNSGILNYINQFGLEAGQYKSNDPVAELYYEGLRYMMGLGPTSNFYSSSLNNPWEKDGYPVIVWDPATSDPVTSSCQRNFALYVGDQFAHQDDYVPGEAISAIQVNGARSLDADAETDTVGSLEGMGGSLGDQTRGRGDGFWIAGLSYWANTNDIRPDWDGFQRVKTFMVDTQEFKASPPTEEDNQLWLAAKYGGFDFDPDAASPPTDPNSDPDLWDPNGDGVPDTYTLASQPQNLRQGLSRAFQEVQQAASSASAAAVVANAAAGTGAIYQALYEPRLSDASNRVVTWSGTIRGLFLDEDGLFREDTNGNSRLDNSDFIIEFFQDPGGDGSRARRLDTTMNVVETDIPVRDLESIWDAREALAEQSPDQRSSYATASDNATNGGRFIQTWIDTNGDRVVDSGEVVAFEHDFAGAAATPRLLGLGDDPQGIADDLVDYVRGTDKPALNWRSRQFDLDGDGSDETLRLGDVVHSAPLVVSAPRETFNIRFDDDTYAAFQRRYADRRQVVYAGANDGMLHAFNGGFFDASQSGFALSGGNGETQHPLGSELWAYVPHNLLPHLQWLKEREYPHVFYVDGPPQAFDVNIFDDCPAGSEATCTHPHGWGTILVVGFRLGGGEIRLDLDGDGNDDRTLGSAYLVFDITDPEQPPELLAEISHPDLGFTTGRPVVVKQRQPGSGGSRDFTSPTRNDWYLVFGSGPAGSDETSKRAALQSAVSNQEARLFAYRLNQGSQGFVDLGGPGGAQLVGDSDSFVGDLSVQDWDGDFQDDALYFGTVADTVANPGGGLWRATIGSALPFNSVDRLVSGVDQPISSAPLPVRDTLGGRPWVYAGSGRFFTSEDVKSAAPMSYYGVLEPRSNGSLTYGTVAKSDLDDVSHVQVFANGEVGDEDPFTAPGIPGNASTLQELRDEISAGSGWFMDFPDPAERYVDTTLLERNVLFFVGFTASNDSCSPQGSSKEYALSMFTGTAAVTAPIGTDPSVIQNSGEMVLKSQSLGRGQYFSSGNIPTSDGTRRIYSGSEGQLEGKKGLPSGSQGSRISWRELPLPDSVD